VEPEEWFGISRTIGEVVRRRCPHHLVTHRFISVRFHEFPMNDRRTVVTQNEKTARISYLPAARIAPMTRVTARPNRNGIRYASSATSSTKKNPYAAPCDVNFRAILVRNTQTFR